MGCPEKNHEERSGIIYALNDATGGGDTKNLVHNEHKDHDDHKKLEYYLIKFGHIAPLIALNSE